MTTPLTTLNGDTASRLALGGGPDSQETVSHARPVAAAAATDPCCGPS